VRKPAVQQAFPGGLGAYRYQPNLECRHPLLKGHPGRDPVLLHNPARIEALFCCHLSW
jgi:hypothetical protein